MPQPLPSSQKMRLGWNAERQQQYRATHHSLFFHFLLDASPSMCGANAVALRKAFNMYLAWLQHQADPMSLADVRCFSTPLDPSHPQALITLQPLTPTTYNPAEHGSGTALYRAVGVTCSQAGHEPQQHVLVVFTDGADNMSDQYEWSQEQVATLLQILQDQQGWLAVLLGAMPDAALVGQSMGFRTGNCLTFGTDQIPEAFQRRLQATQKYLAAGPQGRKLLAAGGLF